MDASSAGAGLTLALLAALCCASALRWWRRRRDRGSLVALLTALHVALVAGVVAAVLARFDDLRAHALVVGAAYAWLAFLAWRATLFVLPPDAPASSGGARVVVRATLAGAAGGLLLLLGLGVILAAAGEPGAPALLLLYGSLPSLLIGAAFGLPLGLLDAALLAALRRGAR